MKYKDIFSELIEENLSSNNPNPCLVKYGDLFLEKLKIIGNQFERVLLSSDINEDSIITTYDKDILNKINIGLNIFNYVEKNVKDYNKAETRMKEGD